MSAWLPRSLAAVAFLPLWVPSVSAHEHETCSRLDGSSCWHAVNEADEAVTVDCDQFHSRKLEVGDLYSYQFCMGLSDGLGYGIAATNCRVSYSGQGDVVKFAIRNVADGTRVQIKVHADKVVVVQRPMWGSGASTSEHPR